MFAGDEVVRFESSDPRADVIERIQEALETLGDVDITKKGTIHIMRKSAFASVLSETTISGKIREKDGRYTVSVDYDCTLTGFGWVIFVLGILFFLVGLLVLIAPYMKKQAIETAVRRHLRDLE